jgi:hypothetical protein
MLKMKRKINVMFYRPPPSDVFLNQLVALYDPPYSHVELSFEDGMASSIFNGETVFMCARTFSNPNYDIVTVTVSEEGYRRARAFCAHAHRTKVGFDSFGMFAAMLPVQLLAPKHDKTFCSRFVLEALQQAQLPGVHAENSMRMTPSRLYAIVSKQAGLMVDTVPARCQRLVA